MTKPPNKRDPEQRDIRSKAAKIKAPKPESPQPDPESGASFAPKPNPLDLARALAWEATNCGDNSSHRR